MAKNYFNVNIYIKKLLGNDVSEESSVLTKEAFDGNVCCICNEVIHLDDKEVFCSSCPNLSHASCMNSNQIRNMPVTDDVSVKTFNCPQCQTEKSQQSNKEKDQTDVSASVLDSGLERKQVFSGPVKERKCTDVSAFFVLAIVLTCFVSVLISIGGLGTILKGSDSCGNICGQVNDFPPESLRHNHGCMGANHSDKTLVMFVNYLDEPGDIASSPRECVSICPKNMWQIFNYCMHFGSSPIIDMQHQSQYKDYETGDDIFRNNEIMFQQDNNIPGIEITNKDYSNGDFIQTVLRLKAIEWFTSERIIKLVVLSIVMSYVVVIIFSCLARYAVWSIPVGMVLISVLGTFFFLWSVLYYGNNGTNGWIATILLILLFFNVVRFKKNDVKVTLLRNKIMSILYKEAGRVLSTIPSLLLISIPTMMSVLFVVVVWFRGALMIESANIIYNMDNPLNHSKALQVTARWLWILLTVWAIEFILNFQRMVVAGAVSQWHFSKNKGNIGYCVLLRSFYNLVRYHLGTVVFGSVIFHPLPFLKYFFKTTFKRQEKTKRDKLKQAIVLTEYLLKLVPDVLAFWYNITSNLAFNETALHGKGYCESLSRSVNMQANHCFLTVKARKFNPSFLVVTRLFVITTTTLLVIYFFEWTDKYITGPKTFDFDNENFLLIFWAVIVISFFTGHFFLSAYQLVMDALVVCHCEDFDIRKEMNTQFFIELEKQNCMQKILNENIITENIALISTHTTTTPSNIEPTNLSTDNELPTNIETPKAEEIKVTLQ